LLVRSAAAAAAAAARSCSLSFSSSTVSSLPRRPLPVPSSCAAPPRTAFKLFDALGVSYKKLNFDALEYAPNNQGNVIRACVQEHTGVVTFPQVFIGGQFFGGAADACVKWKKGEIQPLLEAAGAKPKGDKEWNGYSGDPFEFLPKWMSQNPMRSK
jgi:glutaredoxin-related protein